MSLNPHDRALLEAGREGLEPSSDDRKRLRGAIAAQIGIAATVSAVSAGATASSSAAATAATVGATVASGSGAAAAGTGLVAVAKGLAALVLLAGAGALGYRAMHSPAPTEVTQATVAAPPPIPVPPAATTAEALTTSSASNDSRDEPVTSPPVASPVVSSGTAMARATSPSVKAVPAEAPAGALSQEIRLVADAREALRAGSAARALALLDEHARRFPRGVLSEERDAERVVALCAAGRVDEARNRAARFTRDFPRSTLGTKVRAACPVP